MAVEHHGPAEALLAHPFTDGLHALVRILGEPELLRQPFDELVQDGGELRLLLIGQGLERAGYGVLRGLRLTSFLGESDDDAPLVVLCLLADYVPLFFKSHQGLVEGLLPDSEDSRDVGGRCLPRYLQESHDAPLSCQGVHPSLRPLGAVDAHKAGDLGHLHRELHGIYRVVHFLDA
jgi:hypothetical protein